MPAKPADADAYLASLSANKRATLEKVRKAIRAAAPEAHEGISYGLPAFIQGKPIAGYSAGANHCAYYPMSGSVVNALKADLENYETSKGAIRFPIGKPLPLALIKKLVKARLAEIDGGATAGRKPAGSIAAQVKGALAALEKMGAKKFREDMVARYGITTQDKTLGVSMAAIQKLGKEIGRNHALSEALWDTGVYEGRMLAIYVAEPERVTPALMDRWVRDCDNWAVVDTVCFKLFDQSPHAWAKINAWAKRREEFVKRAGFALLACVALHDKKSADAPFVRALALIEDEAGDERNFVKKGVSWALRAIGRRGRELRAAAAALAQRLAASPKGAARWVGKDALSAIMQ